MADQVCQIALRKEDAEDLSDAISDVLCWASGFEAGREGTGLSGGPLGTVCLREFNIKLKIHINKLSDHKEKNQ